MLYLNYQNITITFAMKKEALVLSVNATQSEKMIHIPITQVVPGMVTARDIYSRNDQLILVMGTKLLPNMIAKMMFYAIESIFVYKTEEDLNSDSSYYNRIKQSEEFKNFKRTYDDVMMEIKDSVNLLLRYSNQVPEQQLLHKVEKIIKTSKNRFHLLEMIYCIHEHDDLTFIHSINVALICHVFGEWLQIPPQELKILTICGLLHDVGKLVIPKDILNKPGPLSKEEYEIIKDHPEHGYLLLLNHKMDDRIRLAALEHHERYDGNGYPLCKTGNDIHPFSMIVAIADVYDAMTSRRVYRGAICPFDVIKLFEEEGKQQYDVKYLIPLIQKIAEIYINHTVKLSNNQKGEIILLNKDCLSRPVIKVDNEFIDLSKHKDLRIESVI
jgi:HD-GYP domain-containing protein (c-di-GMP phosphodiesterase class II)